MQICGNYNRFAIVNVPFNSQLNSVFRNSKMYLKCIHNNTYIHNMGRGGAIIGTYLVRLFIKDCTFSSL